VRVDGGGPITEGGSSGLYRHPRAQEAEEGEIGLRDDGAE